MKKYMVIDSYGGSVMAFFYDEYASARQHKMNLECGLGGYAEIYERVETKDDDGVVVGEEYRLLEA